MLRSAGVEQCSTKPRQHSPPLLPPAREGSKAEARREHRQAPTGFHDMFAQLLSTLA
jgi:hypothetical protein